MGMSGRSDSTTSSSARELSDTFTYRPRLPFRGELKAMRESSGDQIGDASAWAASEVNFAGVVWPASKIGRTKIAVGPPSLAA